MKFFAPTMKIMTHISTTFSDTRMDHFILKRKSKYIRDFATLVK